MFNNRPALSENDASTEKMTKTDSGSLVNMDDLSADAFRIRDKIQKKILNESDGDVKISHTPQMRQLIESHFSSIIESDNLLYTMSVRNILLSWITADILGYGPLEPLLDDPSITEIMVNGKDKVYVERKGLIEKTDVKFENEGHLRRIIDRIVAPLGRRVDESSPMVDARLPSGFRVNATIPPLSLDGALLTIRKFAQTPFTAQDLVANDSMTNEMVDFFSACVKARINIVISGGTGSGKTTLLNVISAEIPETERILTIEDTAELQLGQEHVVRLEKRPPNVEGEGEVTIRSLVINALRMRPDRIIVGEARGGEALDMLQAMNTGHDGSMTTVHANTPRDALRRIEIMVLMAGMDLPLKAIREQIASSIELIIQTERMRDGSRKVVKVSEIQGMEGETIVMQDIFQYDQVGYEDGVVIGSLNSTGLRPKFFHKFAENNISIPEETFYRKK